MIYLKGKWNVYVWLVKKFTITVYVIVIDK